MKISASILAAKLTHLSIDLPKFSHSAIDFLHIDVMDGNFVSQLSFGEAITKEVKELSSIPLDIHLMVNHPEREAAKYYSMKPAFITFHAEATNFGVRLSEDIHSHGIGVGVAVNPGTPLSFVEYLLPYVDMILIMTVDPGFYGQSFVKGGFEKIAKAREMVKGTNHIIQVDGGVNSHNIRRIYDAGAHICVAGSAVFKTGDPNENAMDLKKHCE